MSDKEKGIYQKYNVTRVDGRPVNWSFVLEDTDPIALNALATYAHIAEEKGYTQLAQDLDAKIMELIVKYVESHKDADPDDVCIDMIDVATNRPKIYDQIFSYLMSVFNTDSMKAANILYESAKELLQ